MNASRTWTIVVSTFGLLIPAAAVAADDAEPSARRELVVAARYLHLPVKTGAAKRRMRFEVGGATVREFEIELADGPPDFWAFADVSGFRGKRLTITVDAPPAELASLAAIDQGDGLKGEPVYREAHRPQFHFTSRRGWLNDPNGLVYFAGEYHLFYQHNPYGWDWGNMHWGHAVSPDLVHWRELPIALYPRRFGDWAFSGSAVVDAKNTAGFRTGDEPALVAAYTSTGRGECIALSRDRGRTWTEYAGNPVVTHLGRDPRVFWHEPTRRWVMAVYDEHEGKRWIAFYTAADLVHWEFRSRIEGFYECPDLFELPVTGAPGSTRWVLSAADGRYLLGDFDGREFHPESGKHQLWHGQFYAAQTYGAEPGGRRIQVGWGKGIAFPGMPFNQQMTVPCALTLRTTEDGVRLCAEPVAELASVRGRRHHWQDRTIRPGENLLAGLAGDLVEVVAELDLGDAEAVGFTLRGVPVTYDGAKKTIACGSVTAPLRPRDGAVRLRILVDRGSIEVFGNDGRVALSAGVTPPDADHSLGLFARGGAARVRSLEVFELSSAWPGP
ncbi:MAG TPA: glycoside hydrolase family 32 protein [Isosphaeraceae bacterium]|jgi:fructan beta-fructosidase